MKSLLSVAPTPEQLKLIANTQPGVRLIRGAAGSGKTTTAILALKQLIGVYKNRRLRSASAEPVRVLTLCFNRTLRGYVNELVDKNIPTSSGSRVDVTCETFGRWATGLLGPSELIGDAERKNRLEALLDRWPYPTEFLLNEIEYVLGRFPPGQRNDYVTASRIGRGQSPRFLRSDRERLLREVIEPYERGKHPNKDWNDLAPALLARPAAGRAYDILVVDEAQDFSANQLRAVMHHATRESSVTFVLDSAQRIYARGFTWAEVGVPVLGHNSHKLAINYRNTSEIARFVQPLLQHMDMDDDATVPDPSTCKRSGPRPWVLAGTFSEQVRWSLAHIRKNIDLDHHSVAFLHPKGGGWFDYLRRQLRAAGLGFVEITRESEWPSGPENIALSTMNSAKGIEFDHVFVLGLSQEITPHGQEQDDDERLRLRRLLAMSLGRARESVVLGYKPGEGSELLELLDPATYEEIKLS